MASATASRRKSAKRTGRVINTYAQIRAMCDKPLAQRKELPIGRHGELGIPRKFHLSDTEVTALKAEAKEGGKDFVPNPHNKGFYFYLIEALKALGINRPHSVAVVQGRFKDLTTASETKDDEGKTFWSRWKNKDAATDDETKALDWEGRFMQNVEVLQRVPRPGSKNKTPYGLKLLEVGTMVLGTKGCVIDIVKGASGQKMLRLNTNAALPTNEFRVRSIEPVAAPAKRPAAKRPAKVRKAVTKAAAAPVETPAETAETVTA